MLQENEMAMLAFDGALRHNPQSPAALSRLASLLTSREQYLAAAEYYQRILSLIDNPPTSPFTISSAIPRRGELWASLGFCFLMLDDLARAYAAYQQALVTMTNAKDPDIWYGIGLLYDRYGSDEHAEEAFLAVLKMLGANTEENAASCESHSGNYNRILEIYYRLGIIYRNRGQTDKSLECLRALFGSPPKGLTNGDIQLQLALTHSVRQDFTSARELCERILSDSPACTKLVNRTMTTLAWLLARPDAPFFESDGIEASLTMLNRSVEEDPNNALAWYYSARVFMTMHKHHQAYDAYQQAVYRDGRNAAFWCSIGILYFEIRQFRDALDAFSRAIHLSPYMAELWWNLGLLYEACNQQGADATDAYVRALELDPKHSRAAARIAVLRNAGGSLTGVSAGEDDKKTMTPMEIDPLMFVQRPLLLSGNVPAQKSAIQLGLSSASAGIGVSSLQGPTNPRSATTPQQPIQTIVNNAVQMRPGNPAINSKGLGNNMAQIEAARMSPFMANDKYGRRIANQQHLPLNDHQRIRSVQTTSHPINQPQPHGDSTSANSGKSPTPPHLRTLGTIPALIPVPRGSSSHGRSASAASTSLSSSSSSIGKAHNKLTLAMDIDNGKSTADQSSAPTTTSIELGNVAGSEHSSSATASTSSTSLSINSSIENFTSIASTAAIMPQPSASLSAENLQLARIEDGSNKPDGREQVILPSINFTGNPSGKLPSLLDQRGIIYDGGGDIPSAEASTNNEANEVLFN